MKNLLLCLFGAGFHVVYAQHRIIQSGPGSIALAHASVALSNAWSVYNNPSASAFLNERHYGIGYENRYHLQGLSRGNFAVVLPFGNSGICGGGSYFGDTRYQELRGALGFFLKTGEKAAAAIQLNYLGTGIRGYGYAMSLAPELSYSLKLDHEWTIAAHTFNPFYKLFANSSLAVPAIGRAGVAWKASREITWVAEAEISPGNYSLIKTGLQYQPVDKFSLSIGFANKPGLLAFGFTWRFTSSLQMEMATAYTPYLGFSTASGFSGKF